MAKYYLIGNYSQSACQKFVSEPDTSHESVIKKLFGDCGLEVGGIENLRGARDVIIGFQASSYANVVVAQMRMRADGIFDSANILEVSDGESNSKEILKNSRN